MATIATFCQTSTANGLGHVVRQVHLAGELRGRGHDLLFFTENFPPALKLIRSAGFSPLVIDKNNPPSPDPAELAIVDLGQAENHAVSRLRGGGAKKIVCIENLASGRDCADLLIDSNLDPGEARKAPGGIPCLFGPRYAILHPDFADAAAIPRHFPPQGPLSILVTLGGTDPKGLTAPIVATLLASGEAIPQLTVIAGPGFADETATRLGSTQNNAKVKILSRVEKMAPVIAAHDAVVCAGGITLHEALAAGTPAFVVAQVEHQADNARKMEKLGAAVLLGLGADFDRERLKQLPRTPQKQLESMSRAGRRLVDGRGLHRVADAVEHLLDRV